MIVTPFGTYDGHSWDELCQKCFKIKYEDCGYQEMEASPGDFGIEGFTRTGLAFQCYCPDQHYSTAELYEKTRDKITTDLNKLRTYSMQIEARLSGVPVSEWHFITPHTNKNEILAHIAKKRIEVQGWRLPFAAPEFDIQIRDIDFIAKEIVQVPTLAGQQVIFDDRPPKELDIDWSEKDVYVENINRKNRKRLDGGKIENLAGLNNSTLENLALGEDRLKRIMLLSPDLYQRLCRMLGQYEMEVQENCLTWAGRAEELVEKLRKELDSVLEKEFSTMAFGDRRLIVSHMISKWIALCPIDFSE